MNERRLSRALYRSINESKRISPSARIWKKRRRFNESSKLSIKIPAGYKEFDANSFMHKIYFRFDEQPDMKYDSLEQTKVYGKSTWVGSPNSQATVLSYLFPAQLEREFNYVGDFDDVEYINDDYPLLYEVGPGKYAEIEYPVLYQFFYNHGKIKKIDDDSSLYVTAFDINGLLPDWWLDAHDEKEPINIDDMTIDELDDWYDSNDYIIVIKEAESRKFGGINESTRYRKPSRRKRFNESSKKHVLYAQPADDNSGSRFAEHEFSTKDDLKKIFKYYYRDYLIAWYGLRYEGTLDQIIDNLMEKEDGEYLYTWIGDEGDAADFGALAEDFEVGKYFGLTEEHYEDGECIAGNMFTKLYIGVDDFANGFD